MLELEGEENLDVTKGLTVSEDERDDHGDDEDDK
jgi:hypothetical protein